jgi:hypothetical protein
MRQLFGLLIGGLFLALVIAIYNSKVINTTVLLQAGHEGRTRGNVGSVHGKLKEVEWNIQVTKMVEKELKRHNIDVTRVGAEIPISNTRIAIAIHFDGSTRPCSTGASIGYDENHINAQNLARDWKRRYKGYFPFKWHHDNFTKNLADYYGFSRVNSEKGFLVLELGEITCKNQTNWLQPRLELIALRIADFIMEELDK